MANCLVKIAGNDGVATFFLFKEVGGEPSAFIPILRKAFDHGTSLLDINRYYHLGSPERIFTLLVAQNPFGFIPLNDVVIGGVHHYTYTITGKVGKDNRGYWLLDVSDLQGTLLPRTALAAISDRLVEKELVDDDDWVKQVRVNSNSIPGERYTVTVFRSGRVTCTCPGYRFKQKCRHLEEAE